MNNEKKMTELRKNLRGQIVSRAVKGFLDIKERNMDDKEIESDTILTGLFMRIGISPALGGFGYLKEAIKQYKGHNGIMGELCETIAKKHGTIRKRVERDLRFAIQCAHNNGSLTNLNEILNNDCVKENGCLCCKEFVALIAEYMNNDYLKYNVICKNVKSLNYILQTRR